MAAAHRQQAAYRAIGLHPDWDAAARPRIPAALLDVYDRNVDARRALNAITPARTTLPAWRIVPPAPADQFLASITKRSRKPVSRGTIWPRSTSSRPAWAASTARAPLTRRAPCSSCPSTFAAYGQGGDIHSPHDSIMAAGRYLAANISPTIAITPSIGTTTPAITCGR